MKNNELHVELVNLVLFRKRKKRNLKKEENNKKKNMKKLGM